MNMRRPSFTARLALVAALWLAAAASTAAAEQAGTVALKVDTAGNPAAAGTPVSSGVPFPRGWLATVDHLRLETAQGSELPANYWKIVAWPDGSVKSALVSFVPTPAGDAYPDVVLRYGPTVTHQAAGPVQVSEDSSSLTVTTDVLKLQFSKSRFTVLEQAWTDVNHDGVFDAGERWLTAPADLVVLDRKTHANFRSSLWTSADGYALRLVEAGPQKVTVLLEGRVKGEGGAVTVDGDATIVQAKVWLSVYAGSSLVRVQTTIVDTKSRPTETFSDRILKINSISLDLPLTLTSPNYAAGGESGAVYQGAVGSGASLLQDATATFTSQFAYAFSYSGVGSGAKAPGWMDFSDGTRGLVLGLRHFWQSYPHRLAMDGANTAHLEFLPAGSPNYFWTVYPGVGKTYEGFLDFHAGAYGAAVKRRAEIALDFPMLVPSDIGWYAKTDVFGPISKVSDLSAAWETRVANQYNCTVLRQGCTIYPLPYGQRNFGDFQQGFGTKSTGGYFPIYGDSHYEDAHGSILQFARSGDRRWFDFAVPFARHHYDLDVMHTENPVRYAGFPAGMIHWHGTSEHEGVNIEMGHVVPGGLDDYFYLTGDPRALEVLREQGNWVEKWARNGRSRIAPEKSTDKVGLEEYERVAAWPLYTIMKAYETTADPKYLEGASILVKNNIDWWKMPQAHIVFSNSATLDLTKPPEQQALYYYKTDWTQGTGYPLPTLRVANCPQTSAPIDNYAYQSHAPIGWMSALLQTALIRYYRELDAQGGVFDRATFYRGGTQTIHVDTAIMREMLIQMMKTVVEHNYLGASKYPSKYPWLAGYTYRFFVYSVCPGRDFKSTDGGLYIQWPLLFISGFPQSQVGPLWQGPTWDVLSAKFREIAKIQYDKFVVGKPNPLTGYNGVPDLWNEPYAVNLFEQFGMFGNTPAPAPTPTPTPAPSGSAPAFGVTVNNGDPFLTNPSITLQLTAPSTAVQANVSETGYGQGAWQAVDQLHGLVLSATPGAKTLYVQFRDANNVLLASLAKSVVLLPGLSGSVELALNEAEDTYVLSAQPANNYGADQALGMGKESATHDRWAFYRFSLPALPAGMTLTSARLELFQTANIAGANQVLTPYEPMADWQEDSVSWDTKPALASSGLGAGVMFDNQVNQWKSLPLYPASAQQWFNGTGVFRGIVVKGDGSPAMTSLEAASSEAFAPAADERPRLVLVLSLPVVDTTPPVISGVGVTEADTSAAIQWTTDDPSDSFVEYGATAGYGQTVPVQADLVTAHAVTLTGLTANTTYHARVTSKNAAGLSASSADTVFTTTGPLAGDINRDGVLTQADVIALIGQLLGLQPVTLDVSDVNRDGVLTFGDVQALVNKL